MESLGISRCRCECIIKIYVRVWKGLIWLGIGYLANAVRNLSPPQNAGNFLTERLLASEGVY